ncbi:hypothetical protein ACFOY2_34955 [Nonomuraea purpurea]|uniref:Transposase n=1 Tax=Nonomuraea purpurea TaxID=1849276 RepID=A0ABV8GHG9_9ACTN
MGKTDRAMLDALLDRYGRTFAGGLGLPRQERPLAALAHDNGELAVAGGPRPGLTQRKNGGRA